MNQYLLIAIGLLAQLLFSGRLLVQWISSERARKVTSPVLFWQMSMLASFLLCLYGWLRNDFAIILGQFIAYYIYIWNIRVKGAWSQIHPILRSLFISLPVAALIWCCADWRETVTHFFVQENIPTWLIVFGSAGQLIFTLRFVYQWLYSRRVGESLLPVTFWIISLTGSVMIVSYAVIRRDPVLIIGQSTGIIVYIRNLMIAHKSGLDSSSAPMEQK